MRYRAMSTIHYGVSTSPAPLAFGLNGQSVLSWYPLRYDTANVYAVDLSCSTILSTVCTPMHTTTQRNWLPSQRMLGIPTRFCYHGFVVII